MLIYFLLDTVAYVMFTIPVKPTGQEKSHRLYLAFLMPSVLLSVSSYCDDVLSFHPDIFPRSFSGSSDHVGYVKKNYKACRPQSLSFHLQTDLS